jgi:hypothetical protein
MSDNYPDGSMMGSGIYSTEFTAEDFTCENEECGKENIGNLVVADDWGRYTIECEYCSYTYREGSYADDRDDYLADREPDEDY